jgi:cell division protein ZipA
MDKDILRIVIIAIGALVIAGMLAWHFFKNKRKYGDVFYDDDSLEKIDESLIIDTKDDDFEIIPLGSVNADEEPDDVQLNDKLDPVEEVTDAYQPELKHHAAKAEPLKEIPDILQFGIVAVEGQSFNGEQLQKAFDKVGLKFGSNQIFERLDEYDQVDFAVACIVEPGVFPKQDFDSFTCPGITFFFQPKLVNDALVVFDDLIETIHIIATELGGIMWDQRRQPLTLETQQQIRELLVKKNLKL